MPGHLLLENWNIKQNYMIIIIKIDLNVDCEFYELDPTQWEEYHPQISKDALLNKICEISSNS